MNKSTFTVQKMDCPSEEQLIRLHLQDNPAISNLAFDIDKRKVEVFHRGEVQPIYEALEKLQLDTSLEGTEEFASDAIPHEKTDKNLLIKVLIINASLFVVEIIVGYIANSLGLIADSLDMLADAIVYSLSIYAIGKALSKKKRVAEMSAYFQMALAIMGGVEVVKRFIAFDEAPDFRFMILISLLALGGNLTSLLLLRKAQSNEAHIQASWIFTSNDVLANIGVLIAGVLVLLTHSRYPDLIIGTVIFFIVLRGSMRILKLSR